MTEEEKKITRVAEDMLKASMPELYETHDAPTVELRNAILEKLKERFALIHRDSDQRKFSDNEKFIYTKTCLDGFFHEMKYVLLEKRVEHLEMFAVSLKKKK